MNTLYGILFLAGGLFTIIGVVIKNIGMNSSRAQVLVKIIGVVGTKILYTIIGIFTTVYGFMLLTGMTTLS